jgi:hypothetical protein
MAFLIALAASVNEVSDGDVAWTNPSNILTNDGSNTEIALTIASPRSNTLQLLNFSSDLAAIPDAATIDGIVVGVEGVAIVSGFGASADPDIDVQLVVAGSPTGDVLQMPEWPTGPPTMRNTGGASETWGLALTGADVKATNFGFQHQIDPNLSGGLATLQVQNDYGRIIVYYTEPPPSGGDGSRRFVLTGDFGDRRPGGIHGR